MENCHGKKHNLPRGFGDFNLQANMYQKGKTVLMTVLVSIKSKTIYDVPRFEVLPFCRLTCCSYSKLYLEWWFCQSVNVLMPYGHKETCKQLLHSGVLSARKILQFIIDIIWQFCLKQELTVIH